MDCVGFGSGFASGRLGLGLGGGLFLIEHVGLIDGLQTCQT